MPTNRVASTMTDAVDLGAAFHPSTARGRWATLGPYYAMFPLAFVVDTLGRHCPDDAVVLDPFCGRGTVPFVAGSTGRTAFGFDVNPVAYVFTSAKLFPCADEGAVLARVSEVWGKSLPADEEAENEFQEWCWSRKVLRFLRSARRTLDWRVAGVDQTLMATILVVLHAKLGNGLSNQIRQAKAMSPDYSVRWWKAKALAPPDIDPVDFMARRVAWRYAKGVAPVVDGSAVFLGETATTLPAADMPKAGFVLTSPPYLGVTDYRYDNWIRLWMLGGHHLPEGGSKVLKYENKVAYRAMMEATFGAVADACRPDASVFVRTDSREFTLATTVEVMRRSWPGRPVMAKRSDMERSQTRLYAVGFKSAAEVDLAIHDVDALVADGFVPVADVGPAKAAA